VVSERVERILELVVILLVAAAMTWGVAAALNR
jgi:hypothetical protein